MAWVQPGADGSAQFYLRPSLSRIVNSLPNVNRSNFTLQTRESVEHSLSRIAPQGIGAARPGRRDHAGFQNGVTRRTRVLPLRFHGYASDSRKPALEAGLVSDTVAFYIGFGGTQLPSFVPVFGPPINVACQPF